MNYKDYVQQDKTRISRNLKYMEDGVSFIDVRSVYIDEGVKIGKGTVIYPCVVIESETVIGENNLIGQNSKIRNAKIGNNNSIESSFIIDSTIGNDNNIGPFAYMRPNSNIGNNCKVGDFVEVKNSSLEDGTKAPHLTYIGDSDIGKDVNLGCGVVFVNYDGKVKQRSKIKDGAFIGCNANIVAPVEVGKNAYIAAGSTITKDIPDKALAIARSRETIKEDWVEEKDRIRK